MVRTGKQAIEGLQREKNIEKLRKLNCFDIYNPIDTKAIRLYNNLCDTRSWRNWQTRTFEGRVGDRMGSSPIDRTIMNVELRS